MKGVSADEVEAAASEKERSEWSLAQAPSTNGVSEEKHCKEPHPPSPSTSKSWYLYLLNWASPLVYTVSLVFYLVDLGLDIVVGISMIDDVGGVILGAVFLPVLPMVVLHVMRNMYRKNINKEVDTDAGYKHTLLGVNWFNLRGNCWRVPKGTLNIVISLVFIVLRIDTIRSYCQLLRATQAKNMAEAMLEEHKKSEERGEYTVGEDVHKKLVEKLKNKKKLQEKWDRKLRADLYLIMVCETLPQSCLQIYIFASQKTVSRWQIVSVISGIFDLTFNFIVFQVKRLNAIYRATNDSSKEGDEIQRVFKKDHMNIFSSIIKKAGAPQRIAITLKFKKKNDDYLLKDEELTSKYQSDAFENEFYKWVQIVVELIGSPTFFFTAFPTVSLYAVAAGKTFMLLYVPVFFDFIEKYWWWNPETQRRNLNIAFHTLHLAFKIMLRIMILGLICVWFIRVLKFSNPTPSPIPFAVPTFIWPQPNTFLATIADYNLSSTNAWMQRCEYAPTIFGNLTKTLEEEDEDVVVTVYRFFTSEDVCVSYVSVFVFCIIFYVNLVGIAWEFITYFLFSVFSCATQSKRLLKGVKKRRVQASSRKGGKVKKRLPQQTKVKKKLPQTYEVVERDDDVVDKVHEQDFVDADSTFTV